MGIQKDFIQRLRGRAEFCRDRGEVKTPELLEHAAQLLEEKAQAVPKGFVVVKTSDIAKLAIAVSRVDLMTYSEARPDSEKLAWQNVENKLEAMIEAQEQSR